MGTWLNSISVQSQSAGASRLFVKPPHLDTIGLLRQDFANKKYAPAGRKILFQQTRQGMVFPAIRLFRNLLLKMPTGTFFFWGGIGEETIKWKIRKITPLFGQTVLNVFRKLGGVKIICEEVPDWLP